MYSHIRLSTLAQWLNCPPAKTDVPICHISTDSRTVKAGDLFVALKGENFDGHEFLKEVIQKKVAAVVVSNEFNSSEVPVFKVANTLKALVSFGEHQRQLFQGPVYAITGSAGKSSTKEMLATLLGAQTLASPASFNNLLGVSKTLCLLEDSHQKCVLEMGMNNLFEIKEMCDHFKPHYGLITNVGTAHIGRLGSQENIFRAKKELFDFISQYNEGRGVAVNIADPYVKRAFQENKFSHHQVITFSHHKSDSADVTLLSATQDSATGHLSLELSIRGTVYPQVLPIFGLHQAQNLVAAFALALLGGEPLNTLLNNVPKIRAASHRGEILQLSEERTLIDESYNSNPDALKASLTSFSRLSSPHRPLLVLGEMKELEEFSEKYHLELAHFLAGLYGDQPFALIGVGGLPMQQLVEEVKRTCRRAETHYFEKTSDCIKAAQNAFISKSFCLLKGSRSIGLDKLISFF